MKKLFLIFSLILVSNHFYSQQLDWVVDTGWESDDWAFAMVTDQEGNTYVTGESGSSLAFIIKNDAQGNLLWAKQILPISTNYYSRGEALDFDSEGNIVVTGRFNGTKDFDPGPDVFEMTALANDFFILKLNPDGNFVWAKRVGGSMTDISNAVKIDLSDNIYVTGTFEDSVDFDPGIGESYINSNSGADPKFVVKLNSDGNYLWAINKGGELMEIDSIGNVYIASGFSSIIDLDPGVDSFFLDPIGIVDTYVVKLDSNANFIWAKQLGGGTSSVHIEALALDAIGNVLLGGNFTGTIDFDPGPSNYDLTSTPSDHAFFVTKLDSAGNFVWANSMVSTPANAAFPDLTSITSDKDNNVYICGSFEYTYDFDPGPATYLATANSGTSNLFVEKFDANGNFKWFIQNGNVSSGGAAFNIGVGIDSEGDLYAAGQYKATVDFDPNDGVFNLTSEFFSSTYRYDIFILKLNQRGVIGTIFNDVNSNCVKLSEPGLVSRRAIINPGNLIVESNLMGKWHISSLAAGNYTIEYDTSGNWMATCPPLQNFTVVHQDSLTILPSFGLISTEPCNDPNISIYMPFMRPGFSDQKIYVSACNDYLATGSLNSAYTIIELDSLLIVESASIPFISLGNNKYSFNLANIIPGNCVDFTISCSLDVSAILGQTLCMDAKLFPVQSCVLDTIPEMNPVDFTPCSLPWDKSSLKIEGECMNDSIVFVITNTGDPGDGDMQCYSPVRLFIDGEYVWLDSIQLAGGETFTYEFTGDGRTWRMEVDQHPLHPGNSNPNETIELCGNAANWTSDLVNILPLDDEDPVIDIFCGIVRGSYDPNDKTGYPLGLSNNHFIEPNNKIEYVIRFQNTGTDTAFTVIIRDTLDTDLNIFSVHSGVASHDYIFRMYGPRILEWKFNNILLPDSTTDESGSNGFVRFEVKQMPDLPDGTEINNEVGIYFDYNSPIITNTTSHIINREINTTSWTEEQVIDLEGCSSVSYNGIEYIQDGSYWQINDGIFPDPDTLTTLNVILNNTESVFSETACESYMDFQGNLHSTSGLISIVLPNSVGCDSIITINLTINFADTNIIQSGATLISSAVNADFQWLNCDNGFSPISGAVDSTFTPLQNGNYAVMVTQNGCTDTSECIFVDVNGINEMDFSDNVRLFPNPGNQLFTIELDKKYSDVTIKVEDIIGKMIFSDIFNGNKYHFQLKESRGIYFVTIQINEDESVVLKLIVD